MSYAYTTAPRRRLVLGDPGARHRLCLPVTTDVYEALLALPLAEQAQVVPLLKTALREALTAWQTLQEIETLSADAGSVAREAGRTTEATPSPQGERSTV